MENLTRYENVEDVGASVAEVAALLSDQLEVARELRRELAVHRADEAEEAMIEAVKYLKWASDSAKRASNLVTDADEVLLAEDASLARSPLRALGEAFEADVEVELDDAS